MNLRAARVVLIAVAVATATPAHTSEPKLSIDGRVLDERSRPVAGATVQVYTARPRVGLGSTCPSCYPECAKSAVTDRRGRFSITGLGDHLLYRLLFVAEGRVPEFLDLVDPKRGAIEQVLLVEDTVLAPGLRATVGHVLNPAGKPVAGATLSPVAIRVGQGMMFGSLSGLNARIPPLVLTDAKGEFRLVGPDSITAWVVQVHARDLAPKAFGHVAADGTWNALRLETGAVVTGVLLREGRPVSGAVLNRAQLDRRAEGALPPDTIATDERGRFMFVNVPAARDYAFSGVVGTMGSWALRTVVRTVGENDSTTELPVMNLERGYRLAGHVKLADGSPVPAGTELSLSRTLAQSSMVLPLDAEGRFEIDGLPPETVTLGIRVPGYRIAAATPWLTVSMRPYLSIPMLRDRTGLEILLEPRENSTTNGPPRP